MGNSGSTTTTTTTPSPLYQAFGTLGYFVLIVTIFLTYNTTDLGTVIANIAEGSIRAEYDFIVVGAGSAGAVVANRLSANGTYNVLLLEAGDFASPVSNVPVFAQFLQLTAEDWQFKTEPQPTCAEALNNRKVPFPQGLALGGTSVINYMLYTRGNKNDYDNWGIEGWKYQDVLPYFLKLEDNRNTAYTQTPFHRAGGPVTVEDVPFKTPLAPAYLQACQELGYPARDINGEFQTGCWNPQGTTKRSYRWSSARAYLEQASSRPNLHISMKSFVNRIVIDPQTKQALGVDFTRSGIRRFVRARREVILSAGALQSPKILMLSGVGPTAELQRHSIPVIKDLPVGQDLEDHVNAAGFTFLINQPVSFVMGRIFARSLELVLNFLTGNPSPLNSLGSVEGMGFFNSPFADTSIDWPDTEFVISSGFVPSDGGTQLRRNFNLRDDYYRAVYEPYLNYDMFNIFVVAIRPKSRGFVKLKSALPTDLPIVDPRYYTDPEGMDMKVMIEGCKLALRFGATNAMRQFGARLLPTSFPGCRNLVVGSDDYCRCAVNDFTSSFWHLTGTCKMGGVVDPRLKVFGISRLRVVDASIMPSVISAHTNVPTMMIGEKASDMIIVDQI